jgi:hypothetical protein
MNLLHYTCPFLFLLLSLMAAKVNGQVVATGRVTAEVVESVGASAKVITGFDLKNSSIEEYGTLVTADLNLGTITIHSGKDISCNVVMQPAFLVNAMGNGIEIETAFSSLRKKEDVGTQTLQLRAKARTRSGQTPGVYRGTYEMVFAYN